MGVGGVRGQGGREGAREGGGEEGLHFDRID